MYFNCLETQVRPGPGGGGGQILFKPPYRSAHMGGFRGETGKSQFIWVSVGNKQLDTTPSYGRNWTPLGKCWTPSGALKKDS